MAPRTQRATCGPHALAMLIVAVVVLVPRTGSRPPMLPDSAAENRRPADRLRTLPLAFEPNRGQTDLRFQYLARGRGAVLLLSPAGLTIKLHRSEKLRARERGYAEREGTSVSLGLTLVGANHRARAVPRHELRGKVHHLVGSDPVQWRTNLPTYARVEYLDVYPGIDVAYYGSGDRVEYDLVVRAGADPRQITVRFPGAEQLKVQADGNLLVQVRGAAVRQGRPMVYQQRGETREQITCRYVVRGRDAVGFELGRYEVDEPLVIDPVLDYSTYLGGGSYDFANAITVDATGNVYLAGDTRSPDFPIANPLQNTLHGEHDAFVMKLGADGEGPIYSTYLGGASGGDQELAHSVAVDTFGHAYVTGVTDAPDFPTTPGAYDRVCGGGDPLCENGTPDVFVAKLSPDGSALEYSTYFGGSSTDRGRSIAVDDQGRAYVAGFTISTDLPVSPWAVDRTCDSCSSQVSEAFIIKLDPEASALEFCTYLGGSNDDDALALALDRVGQVYVAGRTLSQNFPTRNPLQPFLKGGADMFVSKIDPIGSSFIYSTYLGGSDLDEAYGIAADREGRAYVVGDASFFDFPTTGDAFQRSWMGWTDAVAVRIEPFGQSLEYSTYVGGKGADVAKGLAVDSSGQAYVCGVTQSVDFPLANPVQAAHGGGDWDVFVLKLNAGATALVYSTFLGGVRDDACNSLALRPAREAMVAGYTHSADFPVTPDA